MSALPSMPTGALHATSKDLLDNQAASESVGATNDETHPPVSLTPLREKDFMLMYRHGAVRHLRLELVQIEDDKFSYKAYVGMVGNKVGREEAIIVDYKGEPRLWRKLDLCIPHIRDNYQFRGRIIISGEIVLGSC